MHQKFLIFSIIILLNSSPINSTVIDDDNIKFKGMTFVGDKYCPEVSFGNPLAKESLTRLKDTGSNWVAIVVTEYQDFVNSTDIYPVYNNSVNNEYYIYKTETIEDLESIINYSHKIGLKVMLKPHIDMTKLDIKDIWTTWRGNIGREFTTKEQWDAWFYSYNKMLIKYAILAEQTGVELFSLSCELIATSKMDSYWRDIIRNVKKVYNGKLIDSANWGGEEMNKTWWDAVDYIGVDAYYTAIKYDQMLDFERNLENVLDEVLDRLDGLSKKFRKDVIVTEIGFCSGNCDRNEKVSLNHQYLQASFYETFYKKFASRKFIRGFFWWAWNSDPNFGGTDDMCISPQYKMSEYVIRKYYGGDINNIKFHPDRQPLCKCTI